MDNIMLERTGEKHIVTIDEVSDDLKVPAAADW